MGSLALLAASWSICTAGLSLSPAHATDAAVIETSGGQQQSGRLLRLGLSKSAVITLPGDAKDVIVGDSGIVDVVLRQKNKAYLFARNAGQTNIFFFGANGQEILHLDLEVAVDSKALKHLLDRSLPGNSIQVDTTGPNIVLKGTVANASEAKMAEDLATRFGSNSAGGGSAPVLNLLKIAQGSQVTLKVRVIELKRTVLKQLGIDVAAKLQAGSVGITLRNQPTSIDSAVLDTTARMLSGGQSITMNIQALEEQGLAKTLAEPTLTAISGAPASFLAGGEFPFRVCNINQEQNTEFCEIQFRPFGVSLAFTPTVLDESRIALNIATEVSELVDRTLGNPSIDTRKAQTSVEIPSGGSMMMAGLIKDVSTQKLRGTPGLRTLPVLGALFSSRDYQQNQTELVVIVTPYISEPVHQKQLATPADGFNEPTDLQQIFLNRLNRVYGLPGERPSGVYHGKVGHIVD
jgi:pilus assembly protein CpaC